MKKNTYTNESKNNTYSLLLLLQVVLENLTDYGGIMVPIAEQDLRSRESITAWPQSDKATTFFLIWIYFPLLIGLVFSLYCLAGYLIPK